MNRGIHDTAKTDCEVARLVAAWIKAFGQPPTGGELAPILGINAQGVCERMRRAADRGWLKRDRDGGHRCYTPVWDLLPAYLRERRPVIA